jgi:hypothetical protein
MNIFKKKLIWVAATIFLFFYSCLPKSVVYKPDIDRITIGDSIVSYVNDNELLYNGNFYFSVPIQIDNKSYLPIYINKRQNTIKSVYKTTITPIVFNLSDSIINPHSKKNIYLSLNGQDILIISNYLANRENLKRNHKFVMNLHFIVGDSIVNKEIIFRPK